MNLKILSNFDGIGKINDFWEILINEWLEWFWTKLFKNINRINRSFIGFIRLNQNYLYYYIKHLRIGGSIFCHCKFLLYPFYPSIRRIIFIVGWSNVCDRVHWSPLSLHFFPLYTIISIIFIFLFSNFVHIW